MRNELQLSCAELSVKILRIMEADGYSYTMTHRRCNYILREITKYCEAVYGGIYTPEAGEEYLRIKNNVTPPFAFEWMNVCRNTVIRLNQALVGNFHWRPETKACIPYKSSRFDFLVQEYEKYLYQCGNQVSDVRARLHILSRFLFVVQDAGITDIRQLTYAVIYAGYEAENSKGEFTKSVRSFLRYLFRKGVLDTDMSAAVPPTPRHKPLPTVYTAEEIAQILASIDRETPVGKRNYTIVLIAARLGLRSCDIANLTFQNINYERGTIRLIQQKTGETAEYPLLSEIRDALSDYIENGRPVSKEQYIFLSSHPYEPAPLKASSMYAVVSRLILSSEIDSSGRRKGAHALRSSLATGLLQEGTSYPVIQKVLGHTSSGAVRHYVRVDIERLRKCALPVPEFSGEAVTKL
ncbi:MAG: tyrosine-type recombinase/integrase [Clostridia bacterium]|nr:tyrosine-type recombinase/integrase [Clostridia bacterium]